MQSSIGMPEDLSKMADILRLNVKQVNSPGVMDPNDALRALKTKLDEIDLLPHNLIRLEARVGFVNHNIPASLLYFMLIILSLIFLVIRNYRCSSPK